MATTRTGQFPIGFRRGWGNWQKDLGNVVAFAKANDFETIDTGPIEAAELKKITDGGVRIGSVDLKSWPELASADAGKRKAAAQLNAEYVKSLAPLGVKALFVVVIPEDHARPRQENFRFAADGYSQLCETIKGTGPRLAIEGWPGGAPHLSSLACTPADYRAFLKELPGGVGGINFDPSHLIRMGIDPVRFLDEFAPQVVHVHGKDTEILEEDLYEHGTEQRATFAKPHGFGAWHWRYTIPGHGVARWPRLFAILKNAGYRGPVSIELEDENFNGTDEGEQRALTLSRDFLAGC